jgi:hypothetical protein
VLYAIGPAERNCHQAALGQDVVGPGPTGLDQLVANASRKWEIGDSVAVQMPQLAPTHPELHSAKPMRRHLHAGPGCDGRSNPGRRAVLLGASALTPNRHHRPG